MEPFDRPPHPAEATASVLKKRKVWWFGIGLFEAARRQHRKIAVRRQHSVENCRVGFCISVAFQFLSFKNCYSSLKFSRGLGLFFPKTVRYLLVRPADQVRRNNVRHSASQPLPFLAIEVPILEFRMRRKFRPASILSSPP